MGEIRLITKKNGFEVLNCRAKRGVGLEDICEIAENEVYDGYADYACVTVDGRIYMELEA